MSSIIFASVLVVDPDPKNQLTYTCLLHPQHKLHLSGHRYTAKAPPCTMSGLGDVVQTHNNHFLLMTSGKAANFRFGMFWIFNASRRLVWGFLSERNFL
jgi:hypothetical protein